MLSMNDTVRISSWDPTRCSGSIRRCWVGLGSIPRSLKCCRIVVTIFDVLKEVFLLDVEVTPRDYLDLEINFLGLETDSCLGLIRHGRHGRSGGGAADTTTLWEIVVLELSLHIVFEDGLSVATHLILDEWMLEQLHLGDDSIVRTVFYLVEVGADALFDWTKHVIQLTIVDDGAVKVSN